MQRRVIVGVAALLMAGPAALAQPAPGEPIPQPGPPRPEAPPVPEGTPILRPGADPHYGRRELFGGFRPDPATFPVTAGGPLDASQFGGECVGWVPEAATIEIFYQPNDTQRYPLIFSAIADRGEDITLAVREPSGTWHCNDDANGTDPAVRIDATYYGVWGVWIGTYSVMPDTPTTLYVSEVGAAWDGVNIPGDTPNLDLIEQEQMFGDMFGEDGEHRVELDAGFSPDPYVVTVNAGGTQAAFDGCPGYIGNGPPDILLVYTAGQYPLLITAYSEVDTTLVVWGPERETFCDDDSIGHDPLVRFPTPRTAVYAIWVGTYSAVDTPVPVRVEISERFDLR